MENIRYLTFADLEPGERFKLVDDGQRGAAHESVFKKCISRVMTRESDGRPFSVRQDRRVERVTD